MRKCKHCGFLPGGEITINGRRPVNPFGSCFDSAARFILTSDSLQNMVMCHAIGISNMPGEESQKIAHAWVEGSHPEHGLVAIDPIWMIAQPVKKYRDNLHAEDVITYGREEFINLWEHHNFPGPYHPKIRAFTAEGKAGNLQPMEKTA